MIDSKLDPVQALNQQAAGALGRMMASRQAFDTFRKSYALEYFGPYQDADTSTLEGWYIAWHSLCICPGGRNGGQDSTMVEIFFGARPHAGSTSTEPSASQRAFIVERGATLRYQLLINGTVLVQLFPAETPNLQQSYDWILLDSLESAQELLKESTLRRHWNALFSCMATTSVIGAVRRRDRWRMAWVQLWRDSYSGAEIKPALGPTLFYKAGYQCCAWFFGVALSGIAVYGLQNRKTDMVAPAVRITAARLNAGFAKLHDDLGEVRSAVDKTNLSLQRASENRLRATTQTLPALPQSTKPGATENTATTAKKHSRASPN